VDPAISGVWEGRYIKRIIRAIYIITIPFITASPEPKSLSIHPRKTFLNTSFKVHPMILKIIMTGAKIARKLIRER